MSQGSSLEHEGVDVKARTINDWLDSGLRRIDNI